MGLQFLRSRGPLGVGVDLGGLDPTNLAGLILD